MDGYTMKGIRTSVACEIIEACLWNWAIAAKVLGSAQQGVKCQVALASSSPFPGLAV